MNEIDFLPEWYRSGCRRRLSYRTQYIALGGIFVVMMSWNLIAGHSISSASAELSKFKPAQKKAAEIIQERSRIKKQIEELDKKAEILKQIDSRIDVATVLAELSYLLNERTALSKVEFTAEKIEQETKLQRVGIVPLKTGRGLSGKGALFLGDVRFKVTINGLAADGGDVAALICRLEDSPYFCRVIPSFSRNTEVKTPEGPEQEQIKVTEFEISCLLANYTGSN